MDSLFLKIFKFNIGLKSELKNHERLVKIKECYTINDQVTIFNKVAGSEMLPSSNNKLLVKDETGYQKDDFSHEIYLSILKNKKSYLFSSCSHRGVINIIKSYHALMHQMTDYVLAGLHLYNPISKKAVSEKYLQRLGSCLRDFSVDKYFTFHCTGNYAYSQLKKNSAIALIN